MAEQIRRHSYVMDRSGAIFRVTLTDTRLIVAAWNADAEDLLDGELCFDTDELRAALAPTPRSRVTGDASAVCQRGGCQSLGQDCDDGNNCHVLWQHRATCAEAWGMTVHEVTELDTLIAAAIADDVGTDAEAVSAWLVDRGYAVRATGTAITITEAGTARARLALGSGER
jgi:hypothetical protein